MFYPFVITEQKPIKDMQKIKESEHNVTDNFSDLWSAHEAPTHLLGFFTFPICFKRQMATEWSTLSSSTTSHVVVTGSALMMALNWLLSTSDGLPL